MDRRGFFALLAGAGAASALPVEVKTPTARVWPDDSATITPLVHFDEPITGMVNYHDSVIVTSGACAYVLDRDGVHRL
jgi:hypothetical protein